MQTLERPTVAPTTGPKAPTPRGKKPDRATLYALDVVGGRIRTGKYVRLAAQRHLDLLESVRTGARLDLRWNQDEAEAVFTFFAHLPQYQGRWADKPLELLDWEAFAVGCVFGWQLYDPDLKRWVRLYREAYVRVARKNGKSTLCGGVGLWCLDFDGESGAQVYAVATKRDQAKQVWTVAQQMVERKPQLASRIAHLRAVSRLIVYETMSVFAALGRDSDTEHGLNPSAVLLDELHIHKDRGMLDAMDTAIGAREQPIIWYITTAGVAGASIYNETDERMRKALDGRAPNERAFVLIYCLDDDDDWRDSSLYIKANPSLGHTVQLAELEAERDKAISTPGRRNSFIRLRLDTDTQAETAWLDIEKWDACQVDALGRDGARHLGVDLGGRQDLSAAVKVTRASDGGLDVDARFWMPEAVVDEAEERDGVPYRAWMEEGWITPTSGDYRDDHAIAEELQTFAADVEEIDLDTWNSTTLLGLLADLGPEIVLIPQTFPSLSPGVTEALDDHQHRPRGEPRRGTEAGEGRPPEAPPAHRRRECHARCRGPPPGRQTRRR
jgi:phage terminase large subunit-like protein